MIPCYVSGKGMHATEVTWSFKTTVIATLESSELGFDTRFDYYRRQFPDMHAEQLARMICDPVEYYDKDWNNYRSRHKRAMSKEEMVTRFMLERDTLFQKNAMTAIYCFDEAGFGSGVNTMRFLMNKIPILGFMNKENQSKSLNISNVLQLKAQFPGLIHLIEYQSMEDVSEHVVQWLNELQAKKSKNKLSLVVD